MKKSTPQPAEEWTQRARPIKGGETRSRRIVLCFTPTMASNLLNMARQDNVSVNQEAERIIKKEFKRRSKKA